MCGEDPPRLKKVSGSAPPQLGTQKATGRVLGLHRLENMRWMMPTQRPDWLAGTLAGVFAGTVFIVLQMVLQPLVHGQSPWVTVRMMAAILLGPDVLAAPATFSLRLFLVAMLVHYSLSIIYSLVGAALLHRFTVIPATVLGGVLGLLLYLINYYGFVLIFPWFAEARDWTSILVHAVFGAIHGCGCKVISRRSRHQ
jgi:hypothetical protein